MPQKIYTCGIWSESTFAAVSAALHGCSNRGKGAMRDLSMLSAPRDGTVTKQAQLTINHALTLIRSQEAAWFKSQIGWGFTTRLQRAMQVMESDAENPVVMWAEQDASQHRSAPVSKTQLSHYLQHRTAEVPRYVAFLERYHALPETVRSMFTLDDRMTLEYPGGTQRVIGHLQQWERMRQAWSSLAEEAAARFGPDAILPLEEAWALAQTTRGL